MDEATYEGIVERRHVGGVSKSAHDAVVLVSGSRILILRRVGSDNLLYDPELEAIVGKRIRARGTVIGPSLLISSWEDEDADGAKGLEIS